MEPKFILESLLFSAQRPMSVKELREVFVNAATEENADEAAKPFKKIKEDEISAARGCQFRHAFKKRRVMVLHGLQRSPKVALESLKLGVTGKPGKSREFLGR